MRFLGVSLLLILVSAISTEGLAMRPRGGPRGRKPKPEMVEQEEAIDSSEGKSSCLAHAMLIYILCHEGS